MYNQLSLLEFPPAPSLEFGSIPINLPDGEVIFYPAFFPVPEADQLFQTLLQETHWQQDTIKIQGRSIRLPRLTAWYGDRSVTYTYSGITLLPHPWTPTLLTLKSRLETLTPIRFNSVLLNLYRDGRDSVAWHSDDEAELGSEPAIGSVSLGGTRRFSLKHKFRRELGRIDLDLAHGSVLMMQGATQKYWLHQVPKTKREVAPRINLTFRAIRDCLG
jgi:alkylated DNA repair dioxygenase AlkB